ncbi:hypothetical protein Cst_c13650 [Thermoclostridium stercorarium subsp. stercorarium DSM 8532]|uniref:SAF domain-containing protein n=5 Tax=Thermoclostridium stercorarium TaxID=1510 RepID=L7VPH9_THES1|nr:SAF domain-containing protein [Thermoclostridium stercorarium]AGC68356.1 hypothetical protein Cst_c13650 [Thermoclostridium stercorarium subsp. stercorarium DSM 8532]AGI39379.1 hypothetical protein Clst_1318 [Thermoclostridium stercorarium subsp. stercorarium DSM 8532]ANX00012.1 hypothetical protein CSTERTH_06470 [Thermoclostridium stercorarium subsp. thermolacticum DSM 2910]ANX02657.1 hypothetical protein CSTERLE_06480 [Thermoclostridium stercorarium subsp. leptospartum DSM 9219]
MAFFRRKRMRTVLLSMLISLLVIILFSVAYCIFRQRLGRTVNEYEENLEKLRLDLYSLNRLVYIPKQDIPSGTVLTRDMFDIVEMKLNIPQAEFIDETDMGKVNMIYLPAGTPVLKMTVADEKLPDDLRELEFNMFLVQSNQKKGDFVDVRIVFPNGENYIVLSKKKIVDIIPEENTIRLWLDETEIHNISSAIIDAYIHPGTKLYVTKYVMPELQEAAIPFYAANEAVLNLMHKDPNIVEKASDALARELRASLERNLNSVAAENIGRVSSGVSEEMSKSKKIIQPTENSDSDTNTYTNHENSEETEFYN